MTTALPPGPTSTPRGMGFGIDPRLGVAALRAPAASKEDYRPQAILRLHHPNRLDYRGRHELPVHGKPPSTNITAIQYRLEKPNYLNAGCFFYIVLQHSIRVGSKLLQCVGSGYRLFGAG